MATTSPTAVHNASANGHSQYATMNKSSPEMHDLELGRKVSRFGPGDLGHQAATIEKGGRGFYGHVGNPGLIGLATHAVTLMLLSTSFMRWRGPSEPQVYVGNLFFYAGLFMMLAFNWCLVKGETFSATVFGSFSGFYLSFGAILTPAFGVAAAYSGPAGAPDDLATQYESLATFLYVWNGIFTCIAIASLRTNIPLVVLFWGVVLGVWLRGGFYEEMAKLAHTDPSGSASKALALSKGSGSFLFISAVSGFYLTFTQMIESVDWPVRLPVGDLSRFWPKKKVD